MDLAGAHVVVTGASRGIGRDLARAFAAEGARVVVVARSEQPLLELAEEIDAEVVVADLTDAPTVDGLAPSILERVGHIDVWVNNAGVESSTALVSQSHEQIRQLVRLNIEATFILTRDALRHMRERGSGHIVQISSLAGAIAPSGMASYAGSKAAVTNFSEAVRAELKLERSPIGITVVSPGPVDNEMWDRVEQADADYMDPIFRRFRRMFFLPKVASEAVARRTIAAVRSGRSVVRLPARYNLYHVFNNLPRRMIALSLAGVRSTPSGDHS